MGRTQRWMAMALAGALGGCGSSSSPQTGTTTGKSSEATPDGTAKPGEPGGAPSSSNASTSSSGSKSRPKGDGAKTFAAMPPSGQVAAALTRAGSCDDLLTRIQDDVAAKIELQAELMRKEPEGGGRGPGIGVAEGGFAGAADSASPPTPPPPQAGAPAAPRDPITPGAAPVANGASGGKATAGPTDHSDTNVQVAGVDEADIVKTDGEHIYLLHGNQLFVLDSWPAAMTSVTNQIDIEGNAREMFVQDGKAVVFSDVYDQGDLIKPAAPAADAANAKIALPPSYGGTFTKITEVSVGSAKPEVLRQIYVQGDYVSARRHGTTVRTVIRDGSRFQNFYGGYIEYRDQWGRPYPQAEIDAQVDDWRDRNVAAVEDTKLADWLPVEREIKDGKLVTPEPRCTDFYAPAAGLANGGVTNIVSFDLAKTDSKLGGAVVLGMADEVYANDEALVLAHRDWRWDRMLIERERTVLHRFEIKDADTKYVASGSVPGTIIDQFAIDENKGVIRVATTSRFWQQFEPPLPAVAEAAAADDIAKTDADAAARKQSDNRVITLDVDGSDLRRLGLSKPLGKDGETIQSARFVGDKAYVVTFERVDPLLVLDLEDQAHPKLLGQLTIPGFSEYMHPIDADHLLTIGQDADASGRVSGLMLQIFDVSEATKPKRTHSFRFGPNGYSEASQNHKAFTFHKPDGAEGFDGLLAFPYVNYSGNFQSTLQVFQVSVDSGFMSLGSIDHTRMLRDVCRAMDPQGVDAPTWYPCVTPEVRRGLFIFGDDDDFVYSISNGGVLVHDLSDLTRAVATVALPFPDYGNRIGFGGKPIAAVGVATPVPTPPPQPAPMP